MYYDNKVGYNVGAMSGRTVKQSLDLGTKIVKAMKNTANQGKVTARKLNANPNRMRLNGPSSVPNVKHRKLFKLRPPGAPR